MNGRFESRRPWIVIRRPFIGHGQELAAVNLVRAPLMAHWQEPNTRSLGRIGAIADLDLVARGAAVVPHDRLTASQTRIRDHANPTNPLLTVPFPLIVTAPRAIRPRPATRCGS